MMLLAGCLLVGLAAWLAVPPAAAARRERVLSVPSKPARRHRGLVPRALRVGPAARRRSARDRARTIQALGALAAELASGQPPSSALAAAAGEPAVWPAALGASASGLDVAGALREDSVARPPLAYLAACWEVAASTGTGLAVAVERLAAATRAAEEVRVELEGQLAGPRSTARMLGLLPAVGLGLGTMLGADAVGWLLGTPAGWACLVSGIALTVLGQAWTGRIAASVERLL
ncbi:MAG: type II secretion protein F [Actinomycetota bacterium]|nr:type II secretion protein F [Actinomycetota bacterium]